MKLRRLIVIFSLASALPGPLSAKESGITGSAPTMHLDVVFGLTTFKSQVVESNDTGTGFGYTLGGYAGKERNFGFSYSNEQTSTNFELNTSTNEFTWQDTILKYRLGPVSLGVVFSHIGMKVSKEGTELLDASGNGIGGYFSVVVPIGKVGAFQLETISVSLANPRNALTEELALGARLDTTLAASFDITRDSFDFLVGYKQRSQQMTAAVAASESYLVTFFGIRTAMFF